MDDVLAIAMLAAVTLLTVGAFALAAVLPAEPEQSAPPIEDDQRPLTGASPLALEDEFIQTHR